MNQGLREEVRPGPDHRRQRQPKEGGASEGVNGAKPRWLPGRAGLFHGCVCV